MSIQRTAENVRQVRIIDPADLVQAPAWLVAASLDAYERA
jgi:hypothetical protein